jgi:hypothetical protein
MYKITVLPAVSIREVNRCSVLDSKVLWAISGPKIKVVTG